MLERVRIVMIGTTHPGNIGAAARAMHTMGVSDLGLVQPRYFPSPEASTRSSGATDILDNAGVYDSLPDALADCELVIGTSARSRSISWPLLSPRECAETVKNNNGRVAILFGREHSGLSNSELDLCHYLVHIPVNPEFSSLNVAAAVQLICYELRLQACTEQTAQAADSAADDEERPVSMADMESFYQHLEQALIEIEFLDPDKPRRLLRRLHKLFNRAQPNRSEMNILRGILSAAQKAAAGQLYRKKP